MHSTASIPRPRSAGSVASRAEASERAPSVLAPSPFPITPPTLPPALGLRLEPGGTTQWRAVDRCGMVIGHVQPVHTAEGMRFRARRYRPLVKRFLDLGDFWSAEDAAWCLHYAV